MKSKAPNLYSSKIEVRNLKANDFKKILILCIFRIENMRLFIPYTLGVFFLLACTGKESKEEFKSMKPDLDEAAEMYCNCMIKADSSENTNPQECREILNTLLLNKCGSNEVAQEYIHEAIRKCVESRMEEEESDDDE